MKENSVNLSSFNRDSNFYGSLDLILTIKSFDLQAIRKRYIKSRDNKSKTTGSVERRLPSIGGIASITLKKGLVSNSSVLCKVKEPRGIDLSNNRVAIAAENLVYIFEGKAEPIVLTNPWFSYIHTVEFHPNEDSKILISSSGFDLIQEYNYLTKELTYEWLAWEHGFNKAKDPKTGAEIVLTRNSAEAESLKKDATNHFLVKNPLNDSLPTAKRAAFINSVKYNPENPQKLFATFFHKGIVYEIDTLDNSSTPIISGLKNPHGGHLKDGRIIATSTATGEIFIKKNHLISKIRFKDLPNKPSELGELEWVQNTLSTENLLIAIDSNRTSFVVLDFDRKLFDMIPYDKNWAVQDLVSGRLSLDQIRNLNRLTSPI